MFNILFSTLYLFPLLDLNLDDAFSSMNDTIQDTAWSFIERMIIPIVGVIAAVAFIWQAVEILLIWFKVHEGKIAKHLGAIAIILIVVALCASFTDWGNVFRI